MSQKLGILKFRPPQPSAGVPVRASVSLSATPLDLPRPLSDTDKLLKTEIYLNESDSFGFTIIADKAACALAILPLGWPGGCDPKIQLHLGETGADTMRSYGLVPEDQNVKPCRVVRCTYDGKGILTCRTSGTTLVIDLTTSVYAEGGVYLALHTDTDAGSRAKVIFSDSRLEIFEF